MILALFEHPEGVVARPGNRVVYDLRRNEAGFGRVAADSPALVWELAESGIDGASLAAEVTLDPSVGWLLRCDRVDFPPGGVAYRHTHPGPGIRRLLFGSIRVETAGTVHEYGAGGAWFESGPDPVHAVASATGPSAFVRVLLLPRGWAGKRTIRYEDAADEEKPKLQRATVLLEQPLVV